MTWDDFDDAQLEALLSGDAKQLFKMLITGQREIGRDMKTVKSELKIIRTQCDSRSQTCFRAAKVFDGGDEDVVTKRQTWVMWTVGTKAINWIVPALVAGSVTILVALILK